MTVKELIEVLMFCEQDLPVFFAHDCCTATAVKNAEFRRYETGDYHDQIEFSYVGEKGCVMLFETPPEDSGYFQQD